MQKFWTDERVAALEEAYRVGGLVGARQAFPSHNSTAVDAQIYSRGIHKRIKSLVPPQVGRRPIQFGSRGGVSDASRAKMRANGARRLKEGHTVSAAMSPTLVPVEQKFEKLPWVRYPRDLAALREVVFYLGNTRTVAVEHGAKAETIAFLDSQIAYTEAIIARIDLEVIGGQASSERRDSRGVAGIRGQLLA